MPNLIFPDDPDDTITDELIACVNCLVTDFPRRLAHAHIDLAFDAEEQTAARNNFHLVQGATNA